MGKISESRRLFEEVLAVRTAQYGENGPQTPTAKLGFAALKANYASLLMDDQVGELFEARRLLEEALMALQQSNGLPETATTTTKMQLAICLKKMGQKAQTATDARRLYQEARALYEEVVAEHTASLGANHVKTLMAMDNLAILMGSCLGDHAEERRLKTKAVAGFSAQLGPNHPTTLIGKVNLAYCLLMAGEMGEARRLYEEVLPVATAVLGPNHGLTRTARQYLGYCGRAGE